MDKTRKAEIIKKFGISDTDTGSSNVQIALLTERIKDLTEHLKMNRKDHHSRRGLIAMVNTRRKLLNYLSREDRSNYTKLVNDLKIRHSA
jgi:small subunit ribosomal protein S15